MTDHSREAETRTSLKLDGQPAPSESSTETMDCPEPPLSPSQHQLALQRLKESCFGKPFYERRAQEEGESYWEKLLAGMPFAFTPRAERRSSRATSTGAPIETDRPSTGKTSEE